MSGLLKSKMVNGIKTLRSKGFFDIIISSSLVKVVSFISAIFLPRFLSKADYGVLTYVDNIRNYILLFNALGIANVTMRFCTKENDEAKKKGIFYTTAVIGIFVDIILGILSIIAFAIIPLQFSEAKDLLIIMAFLPVFVFLNEDIQFYLRALFANKYYSRLTFVYSALMVICQVALAWGYGLTGVAIGRYIAVILSLVVGLIFLKKVGTFVGNYVKPAWLEVKSYIKFGFVMMMTNMASLMMQLNETFILGFILKDELALADYKVASFILTVSIFVSQSLTIFLLPYFVRHMDDKEWIWRTFKKVSVINGVIMIPIHLILILLSKYVILILYGDAYISATRVMQMLLIASFGQTVFRMLPGNILGSIGEEKFNLYANVVFLILHAIIDVVAIKSLGIYGAAFGLTFVYFCSGFVSIWRLRFVCKRNKE